VRLSVSVVVVSWNGRSLLERLLPALAAQTFRDFELVAVDNGSTDGSADLVERLWPEARVLRMGANLGFARGSNLEIARARGGMLVLLNNDSVPEPGWLERAVAAAEASGAGMVATRQLRAEDRRTIDSAGIALDRAAIAWDRGGGSDAGTPEAALPPLFGPSGGAALYRRDLLEDVGTFDAELGMYYEDVDLAWRARLRGWGCAAAPGALAIHLGSASGGRNSPRKRFLLARNKLWVAAKCYPGEGLRRYLGALVLYDAAALVAYALGSPPRAVGPAARRAALAGRLAGLRGLPRQLAKRRAIQARRTASAENVLGAMAPLELPWRAGRRFSHLPEAVFFVPGGGQQRAR
jgi:GT2 family glycosyltransferase